MKLNEIKPVLKEDTTFKIGPENDMLLAQIIEGKPLNASHFNLMARLMVLAYSCTPFTKVSLAECSPTKEQIDCVKGLDPAKFKDLARCWKNCTHFPPVHFDYTAGAPFGTFMASAVSAAGSE
jgi:hypothetical protein